MNQIFGSFDEVTRAVSKRISGPPKNDKVLSKQRKVLKTSKHGRRHERFEKTPTSMAIAGYISYIFLFVVGYLREFLWGTGPLGRAKPIVEKNREGYSPLYATFESFYTRNVYRRLKDVFNRPISSVPGALVSLVDRQSEDHFWTWTVSDTSSKKDCINLASYNYLGYAENAGFCTAAVIEDVTAHGLNNGSSRNELGSSPTHEILEQTVAQFLGVEDAMTMGMGFATNSLNLPHLMNKDCLVLSDEKNHASLILGLRLSAATVMVFKHNNIEHLEKILRKAIVQGKDGQSHKG